MIFHAKIIIILINKIIDDDFNHFIIHHNIPIHITTKLYFIIIIHLYFIDYCVNLGSFQFYWMIHCRDYFHGFQYFIIMINVRGKVFDNFNFGNLGFVLTFNVVGFGKIFTCLEVIGLRRAWANLFGGIRFGVATVYPYLIFFSIFNKVVLFNFFIYFIN